ncbi:oligosaccharide repeat unit polymerase [Vibrio vulnificus]|uniref:oligosaccharide repeat unit polymerase n=1 Tax=Vibrio vulnificus TaxID=672 RepID=UPI0024DF94A0|nr:oligosaccharide repeat unit polymerase [Vibrio vulnificus]MDK2678969.1 oligosaccharide repeat unit polymerase [Vibrio vulnificus]MDK2687743.1 oligosaccharide repeat unit polymerase [Vibrio vulnificus]
MLKNKIVISPVYIYFILYLISNVYAYYTSILNDGMVVEGVFYSFTPLEVSISFFSILLFLLVIAVLYIFVSYTPSRNGRFELGNNYGYFSFLLQFFFIAFNVYYGLNVAGNSNNFDGNSILNLFFILFQPDIIFFITAIFVSSNRLANFNIGLYLISTLLRGWMGGVFLVAALVLCRYEGLSISKRNLFRISIFVMFLIAILPFLEQAKWMIRSGGELTEIIPAVIENGYFDVLIKVVDYILNRFQHVGHVALIYQNSSELLTSYEAGKFIPYWMDGLPQYTLLKFFGEPTTSINSFLVHVVFNEPFATWNTNPGLAGWLVMLSEKSIGFLFYVIFMVLLSLCFFRYAFDTRAFKFVTCFCVIYFFHGWIGAYFNFVFYGFLLFVCYRVFRMVKI